MGARKGIRKYLPQRVKLGISGRFSPFYGSVEWGTKSRRRRR